MGLEWSVWGVEGVAQYPWRCPNTDGHEVVGVSSGWFGVVGVSVCRLMSLGTSAGAAHSEEGDLADGGVDRSLGIFAGIAHSELLDVSTLVLVWVSRSCEVVEE